jgi:single-strand DNA-binding protein
VSIPVTLTGRLTADAELRFSAKGSPVARFTVVTSRRVRDSQSGEWSDQDTSFWDCVAFGQLAENVVESLQKGTAVLVTGRAAQRSWEDKEGQKRRSIEVTADEVAPSLRFASTKVNKVSRTRTESTTARSPGSQGAEADPWAAESSGGYSDEPPF